MPKRYRWKSFKASRATVCPVRVDELVFVKFRDGTETPEPFQAGLFEWHLRSEKQKVGVIAAFRIHKPSTVSRTLAADTNDSRKAENSNVAADRDERGRFAKKQISTFNVSDNFDDSVFHPRENSRASFDRGYAEGESDGFMSGCVFTSVVIVAAALFFWFLCRNGVLG